jgi:hypothetical protein
MLIAPGFLHIGFRLMSSIDGDSIESVKMHFFVSVSSRGTEKRSDADGALHCVLTS